MVQSVALVILNGVLSWEEGMVRVWEVMLESPGMEA